MSRFVPSRSLLDRSIVDERGELVGWAGELLIDVTEGRIEYVRVALADGVARSGRTVIVPWSVLHSEREPDGRWKIDARKSLLESLAARQSQRESRNSES